MTRCGLPVRCLIGALALLCAAAAQARPPHDDRDHARGNGFAPRQYRDFSELREAPQQRPGMSLDEAVGMAGRQGRVLSADVVDEGGGPAYRIKVLTPEGRVRMLYFGAGGR